MRLNQVATGHTADVKARFDELRRSRGLVPDVVLTLIRNSMEKHEARVQ